MVKKNNNNKLIKVSNFNPHGKLRTIGLKCHCFGKNFFERTVGICR